MEFFVFCFFLYCGRSQESEAVEQLFNISQSEDRARLALSASGTWSTGHVTLRGSGGVRDAVSPWHFY